MNASPFTFFFNLFRLLDCTKQHTRPHVSSFRIEQQKTRTDRQKNARKLHSVLVARCKL